VAEPAAGLPGPELLSTAVSPSRATIEMPGVGGVIRTIPEDFRVRERPAYEPDGRPDAHVLFTLRKRGFTTDDAVRAVAKHLGVGRAELGVAGLKDRHAVTTQWVSAPASSAPRLETFSHPDLQLGPARPHGNKLRRGHLVGNEFEIVIRQLVMSVDDGATQAAQILASLQARGGVDNFFGTQRFGHGGRNAEQGIERLQQGRKGRRADFILSAGQSALFNLYALARRADHTQRRVLSGDVLKKVDRGGLFVSDDPATDQARLDRGELVITGPMFGSKMKSPPPDTDAYERERGVLQHAGVGADALAALGKSAPGTRRPLLVPVQDAEVDVVSDANGSGVRLRFFLPAGSYATVLLREIQGVSTPDL
jgi:tRNA pseudouridine13 synthase